MNLSRQAQDERDVIVRRQDGAGIISLNRPQAIHALTLGMVEAMIAALLAWRVDPDIDLVMIDHHPDPSGDPKLSRGFCSGGDINLLRQSALRDGGASGRAFFFVEYRLNHLIKTLGKPVVAFMDGITMGGGVGIAGPASFRVATENTRLAMPESGIGLFPDVGGGWYLSRLHHRLGQYLALTGARLNGAECLWAGLATHYLPAAVLVEAKARLAAAPQDAAAILAELSVTAPEPAIAARGEVIARLFAADDYETILAALDSDGGLFARETLATLATKSPQACKVALRQLEASAQLTDFAANMAMEYRIACRMLTLPDFVEGVRAVIVDKDHQARWNPATPAEVTTEMLDAIFAPLPATEEWSPL